MSNFSEEMTQQYRHRNAVPHQETGTVFTDIALKKRVPRTNISLQEFFAKEIGILAGAGKKKRSFLRCVVITLWIFFYPAPVIGAHLL